MQELLYPRLIEFTNNSINLKVILQIADECRFNMRMFNINEHYNTTDEVRTFIKNNNIDETQDFLVFTDTYRNQCFYINFRIIGEPTFTEQMTAFTYSGKDFLREEVK